MANQILADHPDVIGSYVGDWEKSQTLADTGYKFIDKRINRQVRNNYPIMTLVRYSSYKASLRCKEVRKFNERTTRTCSCCGHVIVEGLSPSVRTFTCAECGFTIPRDINSTLNFLNIYQFAVWYSLRALQCLSIARLLLNPSSGKNRTVSARTCVLNYQDACSL
jgi:transcription elongation factor Elf1